MNPSDVTDAMVERFRSAACFEKQCCTVEESIAASVNAVLGDPTPITAERLVENGWKGIAEVFQLRVSDDLYLLWDGFDLVVIDDDSPAELPQVKTIGQLRALEIGLGITPCP